jgi:hypothetical protein
VTIPILLPSGATDTTASHPAPVISFSVPNIATEEALIPIGESAFEDYSRQQLEGNLTTHDMEGHAGNPIDPRNFHTYDLTQLELGQPLAIEIATDDLLSISRIATLADRTQYLIERNYSPDIASVFAASMGKFSPRFFTKDYVITISQDTGFKLSIGFVNIIELSFRGLS